MPITEKMILGNQTATTGGNAPPIENCDENCMKRI
jgi:hypothetical protein